VGGREELGSAAWRGKEEGGTKLVSRGSLKKSVKLSVLFWILIPSIGTATQGKGWVGEECPPPSRYQQSTIHMGLTKKLDEMVSRRSASHSPSPFLQPLLYPS
jgi:hypothetical protein